MVISYIYSICWCMKSVFYERQDLCEETAQQMRWHKEVIPDSEDAYIMSHPMNSEAW
jgi:hypothetical protein